MTGHGALQHVEHEIVKRPTETWWYLTLANAPAGPQGPQKHASAECRNCCDMQVLEAKPAFGTTENITAFLAHCPGEQILNGIL